MIVLFCSAKSMLKTAALLKFFQKCSNPQASELMLTPAVDKTE